MEGYVKYKHCVECGEQFMILQKVQETKKYCGYTCQASAVRRAKQKNSQN
tara:strand:- start:744 stop:893 length:150 start_codon:yes stop_codon:yes gene_type:complete